MNKKKLIEMVRTILTEAKKVNISQPVSNLYIKGSGLDINGNMRIIVGFPNDRGFPIQTNGTLPETDYIISRKKLSQLSDSDLETIGTEITKYVSKHGSSNVKSRLKVYSSYKDKF